MIALNIPFIHPGSSEQKAGGANHVRFLSLTKNKSLLRKQRWICFPPNCTQTSVAPKSNNSATNSHRIQQICFFFLHPNKKVSAQLQHYSSRDMWTINRMKSETTAGPVARCSSGNLSPNSWVALHRNSCPGWVTSLLLLNPQVT
jgi:hypothetical protein